MLADNENIPSRTVSRAHNAASWSIITMSILIFLDLMYWRSNMTFSLRQEVISASHLGEGQKFRTHHGAVVLTMNSLQIPRRTLDARGAD